MKTKLPVLLVILSAVGLMFVSSLYRPVSTDKTLVNFTIEKGQGLDTIGNNLYKAGLIRHPSLFKIEVVKSRLSTKIQAGDYSLSRSLGLRSLIASLTRGISDKKVTFLEGWRREEIALEAKKVIGSSFDDQLFIEKTATLEGKLYPDTYSVTPNTTPDKLISMMTTNFDKKTADLKNNSGLTDRQALILASLIEREALFDNERPVIAGIMLKRYQSEWPLQIDATIQYFKANNLCKKTDCDWWPQNITRGDIDTSSPYNTYLNLTLPPAPISNPSLESIKAAYNPESSPYWFYLHGTDGKIRYGKTIEEHNENIRKYL